MIRRPTQRPTERPDFDLYEDLLAIARIEAAVTNTRRRAERPLRDFSRLVNLVPALRG